MKRYDVFEFLKGDYRKAIEENIKDLDETTVKIITNDIQTGIDDAIMSSIPS